MINAFPNSPIEILEQSTAISTPNRHRFASEEVLELVNSFQRNTYLCPICKNIIFPSAFVSDDGEFCMTSEMVCLRVNTPTNIELPDKACINCKTRLEQIAERWQND